MTNGERIRNMSDEELALFAVSGGLFPCNHCVFKKDFACNRVFCDMCRPQLACAALEIWLREEV